MNFPGQPAAFYELPRQQQGELVRRILRRNPSLLFAHLVALFGPGFCGFSSYAAYRALGGPGFLLPMAACLGLWTFLGVIYFKSFYCPRLARVMSVELESADNAG